MSTIQSILSVLAAVAAAPLAGALIAGVDRKLTARMQGRIGPPILQPFYDVIKLFGKSPIALNKMQILYAYFHLAFMIVVVALLAMGQDMLLILFVHAFSTVALILGGMSVRSPYSRIGSQRKIVQMLAYEPVLILMVVAMYFTDRSFLARDLVNSAAATGPLLARLPLTFIALLMAVAIKLEKSPFDLSSSHHAHQEIVKGITLEYSGPYLAVIEIAHFYETAFLFAIVAAFWLTSIPIGLAIAAGVFLVMIIVDNVFARLTVSWMLKYMWTVGVGLALANILWLHVGRT